MCGIAGIVRFGRAVEAGELLAMTRAMTHRGPDDRGHVLIDSQAQAGPAHFQNQLGEEIRRDVGLGNRRLAIIDLSKKGHQPMEVDGCTLVYNGEIYNHVELRKELEGLGHRFRSDCDTEVLLRAYISWGRACLDRFNGIFAFAIWDRRRAGLFCARDHLGVKPFYYRYQSGELIFCSELKGMLAVPSLDAALHEPVIYDYLTSGRLDHTHETFFSGIERLPAGSWLELDAKGMRTGRYWDVKGAPTLNDPLKDSISAFHDLFHDCIRFQMRSDVPVGCCLSGGLDSSAVVSVAADRSDDPIRVFTARFRDPRMDEWRYAEAVHRDKKVEPVAVYAEPDTFWEHLPEVVRAQEEPFGGPGVFVQWWLMRCIAENNIRVVLNGQGGDELLCGYAKYFYFSLRDLVHQGRFRPFALSVLDALRYGGSHLLNFEAARRYLPDRLWLNRHRRRALQPDFETRHAGRTVTHPAGDLRTQQILDIERFSLPVLLRYEDKNSMAHSIESRVPFLDRRLVELAVGMPTNHKIEGSESKLVMRRALEDEMPREIIERRSKLGFGGTYDSWIEALDEPIRRWLADGRRPVERFVRRRALERWFRKRDVLLFRGLILDTWLREFGF